MRALTSKRGVALPAALLVIGVLSVLVAAGFSSYGSEQRLNANGGAQLDAFALAQTGLERFLARRDSLGFTTVPPAASESARITLPGGYADVVLQRVRNDAVAKRYGYALRSHGVSTARALRGTPQAERTVAEYAVYEAGTMSVLSSWTSMTGLHKNGASAMGSGVDQCGAAAPVAGVAVPTNPGYTQNGGGTAPQGSPPVLNLGTAPQTDASVKIDWPGIVNGTAVTADIVIPPGFWPSFSNASYWPVIRVEGNYTLPGDGRGTLIVTGNLTISGNKTWDGVLLVGGNLTSNGNNGVHGATITGLNVKLGQVVPEGDVGNGTKHYNYNSCNVASAMSRFGALTGVPNAWVDNWPTY